MRISLPNTFAVLLCLLLTVLTGCSSGPKVDTTKPLDLKFTAFDGTPVDIDNFRGKVVLVQFWATWCPTCREEMPDVIAAYKKYHERGFEIIGISLDDSKASLDFYIKDHAIPWPQYFDGKGWDNELATRFGIRSTPTMWLVGKEGRVVSTDATKNLDGQLAQLLNQ